MQLQQIEIGPDLQPSSQFAQGDPECTRDEFILVTRVENVESPRKALPVADLLDESLVFFGIQRRLI